MTDHSPEWYVNILPGTAKVLTYRQTCPTIEEAIRFSIEECVHSFKLARSAIIVIEAGLVDKTEAGL